MQCMQCMHCMNTFTEQATHCPYCGKPLNAPNPPHHLAAGTVLNGRYLVGSSIGEGGFGITYVGFDQTLELKIAIKEYFPSGCANRNNTLSNEVTLNLTGQNEFFKNGRENFLREAKSIAKFSNERGIVDVRDFFTQNNTAYIIMEFLEGKNLNQYILQNGVFQADRLLALMEPLMQSLEKMHNKGVIHRDISPDNIMYLDNGILKLMDFGAARYYAGDGTRSMSVVLKQGYAPYEQYSRKGNQGPWTDVYALCATIYKCITGKTPPDSLDRCMEDTLTPPTKMGIAISPAVENALMKGLAIYPTERCQSVGELMELMKTPAAQNQPEKNQKPSLKKTEPAGIREDFKNKTVAADIPAPNDKQKTVAADTPAKHNEQKTVAADVPVINQSAEKPNKKKKKKHKKAKIIIASIVGVILIGFLSVFIATQGFYMLPQGDGPDIDLTDKMLAAYEETKTFSIGNGCCAIIKDDGTVKYYHENSTYAWVDYEEKTGTALPADMKGAKMVKAFWNNATYIYYIKSDNTVSMFKDDGWSGEGSEEAYLDLLSQLGEVIDVGGDGETYAIGLKKDGTVVAVGEGKRGVCDVSDWKDIVAIQCEDDFTYGITKDGRVMLTSSTENDLSVIKNAAPVPPVVCGGFSLRKNGTMFLIGDPYYNSSRHVKGWSDIIQVSQGFNSIFGLKTDGTVICSRDPYYDISGWKNIISLQSWGDYTIGKKSDGTFVVGCQSSTGKQTLENLLNDN